MIVTGSSIFITTTQICHPERSEDLKLAVLPN
jgi:hypothetical protein